jgi:hypothetical protein
MALAAQFVEAAIADASQQERSLRLFAQWGGTVPQSGEDILYGIFRLVFVAQQDVGCLEHPAVLRMEEFLELFLSVLHLFSFAFILYTDEQGKSLPLIAIILQK